MRDALAGKVALVTGASRGIGAAIARRFAAEGARVAMVARSLEPGSGGHLAGSLRETADDITADGGTALPIAFDLADAAADRTALVSRVHDELGPVDVLVNNAAACFYLPIDRVTERRLRVAYEVNVITPYLLVQAVVPSMRERGGGWVCNIASGIALGAPVDSPDGSSLEVVSSTYAPSKAALNRLTRSFAAELRRDRIAVNAVAPEKAVRTEGANAMMELPDEWCEPIEMIVETALALCTCDAGAESGLVTDSAAYLRERRREVRTLDGRGVLVPAVSGY